MKLALMALGLIALGPAPLPANPFVQDALDRLDNGELYGLEVVGIPMRDETPFRITPEGLRRYYVFRIEVGELPDACVDSFRDALSHVVADREGGSQPENLRYGFFLSGRAGVPPVALYVAESGAVLFGNAKGDGSPLIEWLDHHVAECFRE